MKASTFAVASSLAGASYGAISPKMLAGIASPMMANGIASAFTKNMVNSGYGKTWAMGGLPTRVDMTPRIAGTKTVKIRYGPYKVPNMGHKNGLGEGGSMWNYPDIGVTKPCSQCILTGFRAGLEYMDGRSANIDTDAWLHHFVLFNQGTGRKDATCGNSQTSIPHYNVDCTPGSCERLFSSGNERTPAWMSDWGSNKKPAGYHLASGDKFSLIVDLMNDSSQDKTVYLTITYDYVDGWPSGYDDMRPVWFDVDQCGLSEVDAKSQTGAFTVRSWAWTANMNGEILGYAGHLHDGGQRVVLSMNGAEQCSSRATYGGDPAYIAKGAMGAMSGGHGGMAGMLGMRRAAKRDGGHGATVHISKMSICQGSNLATKMMQKGQSWLLSADYDYSKNPGVKDESGLQASIMGIAIMYVRQPWSGSVGGGLGGLFGRSEENASSVEAEAM